MATATESRDAARTRREELIQKLSGRLQPLITPAMSAAGIHPERLIQVALLILAKRNDLVECDPWSIALSVAQATALNLDFSGLTGEAYLVPFKEGRNSAPVCTLIPGYKGYCTLAYRTGLVSTFEAKLVYQYDEFDVTEGSAPAIHHKPKYWNMENGRRVAVPRPDEDIIAVYLRTVMKDGSAPFSVMTRAEVDKRRAASRAGQSEYGPWVKWFPEQTLKTGVRHGVKLLPMSASLAAAIELDNRFDTGEISAPNTELLLDAPNEMASMEVKLTERNQSNLREKLRANRVEMDPDEAAEAERQARMDAGEGGA